MIFEAVSYSNTAQSSEVFPKLENLIIAESYMAGWPIYRVPLSHEAVREFFDNCLEDIDRLDKAFVE